jgi:1-aminocyclopropane-1-carboxylate deaminase/D-cysteine desulfhydrase-like pyridoxal-dependent ACC family enzyme
MSDVGEDRHAWIRERIARVPRIRLALTPTPLEEAPNLSRVLGGPRILIKRDDLTGVAFGGNKLRNLDRYRSNTG